jgi:hypothetical protein
VWQLQRRAYEGEGQRDWTGLEGEIPLTENGHMMKDLPILWVPGKSPMVMQSGSFGSQEVLTSPVDVDLGVTSQGSEARVKRWYTFGRR